MEQRKFALQRKLKTLEILEEITELSDFNDLPLNKAMELARKYSDYFIKESNMMNILVILCETIIGVSSDGYLNNVTLVNGTPLKDARPCVKWALDELVYLHAMAVCGSDTSMNEYLDTMD